MAQKSDLKDIIINIIKEPNLSADHIDDNTQLIGEEGIFFDSIDVLELIVEIEKKYGIKIKDNDIIQKNFTSFQKFYDFVNENEKK